MPENTNRQFGKYHLISHLATGGMADIFLASQKSIGGFEKLLVIKRILPNLAKDRKFIEMFLDEARIAAQLNHPNVIQIFDLGQVQGRFFIAMEYLSGESLSYVIRNRRKFKSTIPSHLAAGIIMQAAEGLHHAHEMTSADGSPLGIVHRDISPQNIFIQYDGGVKVVDFGIAKATMRSTKTKTGTLKGKYSYMSPEQVQGVDLDARSDVFALGIVFWECLVGRKLFNQQNDLELLKAVVGTDAPSPKEINPYVPQELADIVLHALSRRREDRYQSAAEFRRDLAAYLKKTSQDSDTMAIGRFMREAFSDRISKKRSIIEGAKRLENDLGDNLFGDLQSYVSDTEISVPNSVVSVFPTSSPPYEKKTRKMHLFLLFVFMTIIGGSAAYLLFADGASTVTSVLSVDGADAKASNLVKRDAARHQSHKSIINGATEDQKSDGAETSSSPDAGLVATSSGGDYRHAGPGEQLKISSHKHRQVGKKKRRRKKSIRVAQSIGIKIKRKNTKEHSAPPGPPGRLRLMTSPWSTVYYKGKNLGQTPLVDVELPSGPVELRLVNRQEGIDKVIVVNIKPGRKNVFRKSLY